ncbi:HAMP domain-containing sensor histidine kinase [Edaphobacter paludis]|uniref:histidine kinase n=1 Tax=Edaphobacter paludis TaxID=3035702 RepID=A0AAU7DBN5_9BACT
MHEINNPLDAAGNLAYLIDEEAENPAKVRQYARLLAEQLATVRQIATRTLTFYRKSSEMKPIDLILVAEAALRVHQHKISTNSLQVRKVFPEKAAINGHAGEMLQVLSNLVGNALDALPIGGSLALSIRKAGQEIHIMVADNGHGIPESILSQIFEPFFTTKQDLGTGLGLAISKSIVEGHHGRLKTRSSIRQGRSGTAFRISLPAC